MSSYSRSSFPFFRRLLPVFLFSLMMVSVHSADIPCIFSGVERVVAVGDLHGDYENFVTILRGCGIVDSKLRWNAGRTHLVQTGDIMDRGPDARRILDLLRRLEIEAASAGGNVHVLIGNHEELNITGIVFDYPGYVTTSQFVSFLPAAFRENKEREFREILSPEGLTDKTDASRLEKFWQSQMVTSEGKKSYIDEFNRVYGAWFLEKNAVIKINDVIYVHGGLSREYSTWNLKDLNEAIRRELRIYKGGQATILRYRRGFRPKIVYDSKSPLWYRDFATQKEKAIRGDFDRVLRNLDARAMVIAHTFFRADDASPVISPSYMSRFDGKLWIIDTGISSVYGGANSALIVENGVFTIWGETDARIHRPEEPAGEFTAEISPEESEGFLESAEILSVIKTKERGRTDPWTVILDDSDTVRKAIFKYVDRPRPSPFPASYRYELAAYELAKLLDLDIVPPVIEREIEGIPGSLQLFVENAVSLSLVRSKALSPPYPSEFRETLDVLRLFAFLAGDSCTENEPDTFVKKDNWKLYRVDFSEAFGTDTEWPSDCDLPACPQYLLDRLLEFDEEEAAERLSPYLAFDEMEALFMRRHFLLLRQGIPGETARQAGKCR